VRPPPLPPPWAPAASRRSCSAPLSAAAPLACRMQRSALRRALAHLQPGLRDHHVQRRRVPGRRPAGQLQRPARCSRCGGVHQRMPLPALRVRALGRPGAAAVPARRVHQRLPGLEGRQRRALRARGAAPAVGHWPAASGGAATPQQANERRLRLVQRVAQGHAVAGPQGIVGRCCRYRAPAAPRLPRRGPRPPRRAGATARPCPAPRARGGAAGAPACL
jgi:hypothetical protein